MRGIVFGGERGITKTSYQSDLYRFILHPLKVYPQLYPRKTSLPPINTNQALFLVSIH